MPRLIGASALRRVLYFDELPGCPIVEYRGGGLGWEAVFVNGDPAAVADGHFWFSPTLEFALGGDVAAVTVTVWPWFRINRFCVWVGSEIVYAEQGGFRGPIIERSSLPNPTAKTRGLAKSVSRELYGAAGAIAALLLYRLMERLLSEN